MDHPLKATATAVAGLDVGGAHVKAARLEGGRIVAVVQIASPLWQGIGRLEAALAEARAFVGAVDRIGVVITAELADTFESRHDGVAQVVRRIGEAFQGMPVSLYAGPDGLIPLANAAGHVRGVASANWHATANLVARVLPDALLVDIGSTTADLVPVRAGTVAAAGYSDAERLAAGELVYTGATRTSLMAVADRVPFGGAWQPPMNEHFAAIGDVHRITGALPDGVDQHATADARGQSVAESRARLARLLGRDTEDASEGEWRAVAGYLAELQLRTLHDAAAQVLSRTPLPDGAPLVTAGIGAFLAERLAARLERPVVPFAGLLPVEAEAAEWASRAAPAVAVGLLAAAGRPP
ncbi:hydantoinase/oxoprolinase family protein [Pseudoxanthobacter sp. M-2]|uniref:hydantoinase/oxoprolinase family protein n=1 Tax=Pseudoxanthobacter sp. M-2 TaxID=3078754 RepID=UPI0038FC765E